MQHTRDLKGVVQVDGEDYEWEVRRQPQRTTGNNWDGIGLALKLVAGQREAIVLFPMVMRGERVAQFRAPTDQYREREERGPVRHGRRLGSDLARQGGRVRRGRRR